MKDPINWDDLRYFRAVIEEGSVRCAADRLAVNQTTVVRRVQALESSLALKLLDRTQEGYHATPEGEKLFGLASPMAEAIAEVERWRSHLDSPETGGVRIAASPWVSHFLTLHHDELSVDLSGISLELVTSYSMSNLANGEVDLALRHRRPDQGRLVMRRLFTQDVAVYGSRKFVEQHPAAYEASRVVDCDWIGYSEPVASVATSRALAAFGVTRFKMRCTSCMHILHAAKAGVGLALLPYFVGENDPDLVRVTPAVPCDGRTIYLVMHEDMRNVPRVRRVADRLVSLMETYADSLLVPPERRPSLNKRLALVG